MSYHADTPAGRCAALMECSESRLQIPAYKNLILSRAAIDRLHAQGFAVKFPDPASVIPPRNKSGGRPACPKTAAAVSEVLSRGDSLMYGDTAHIARKHGAPFQQVFNALHKARKAMRLAKQGAAA